MKKGSPVFKFATLRDPNDVALGDIHQINLPTAFVVELKSINESTTIIYQTKINNINAKLQAFISSDAFIKTKQEFEKIKDKSFKTIRKLLLQFNDRKSINKIIEQWLNEYGESNEVTPWSERKSILATAFEGYSYGTERGQIRDISDHNHIIPLYDYGVGVYDFDMSKVRL